MQVIYTTRSLRILVNLVSRHFTFATHHSTEYNLVFVLYLESESGARTDEYSNPDSDVDEDSDSPSVVVPVSALNGVFWNGGCWEIESDCSQATIPVDETAECRSWRKIRMSTSKPIKCIANECPACMQKVEETSQRIVGTLVLHTHSGTQQRALFETTCNCGALVKWNPGQECIHTIRNNGIGSRFMSTLFSATISMT